MVKGDPEKSLSGIETERKVEQKEVRLEVSLVGIHLEERGLTFAQI